MHTHTHISMVKILTLGLPSPKIVPGCYLPEYSVKNKSYKNVFIIFLYSKEYDNL